VSDRVVATVQEEGRLHEASLQGDRAEALAATHAQDGQALARGEGGSASVLLAAGRQALHHRLDVGSERRL
jgi:hypothetical protein